MGSNCSDVDFIKKRMKIKKTFSKGTLEELIYVPKKVLPKELENRQDLRDKEIFTIDGKNACDLDDAISLEINNIGNYVLGVHISDVSHYVKMDSSVEKDAYQRGMSIYLINDCIPMLPKEISSNICSLKEGVDRLTITCEIELNKQGNVVSEKIYKSVINSKKKMTYDDVNEILENKSITKGYEKFVKTLTNKQELSQLIRKNKEQRGIIEFNTKSTKFKLDSNGRVVDIMMKECRESEKIIEDFMMLANETIAKQFQENEIPFLYRSHPIPNKNDVEKVMDLLSFIGYDIKEVYNNNDYQLVFQTLIQQINSSPNYEVLVKLLIRCMKRAQYSPINEKHFGIGSECYTHFTAPIRRYPDLIVHRLVKKYIIEKNYNNVLATNLEKKLLEVGKHASTREAIANECERLIIKMKQAEYMKNYIGETFYGYISNITKKGVYVELENLIQGLIEINELSNKFVYNPNFITLKSINSDLLYKIGSKVKIVVSGVSSDKQTIKFKLIDEKGLVKIYK